MQGIAKLINNLRELKLEMNVLDCPDDILRFLFSDWLTIEEWIALQNAWCYSCSWPLVENLMRSTNCNIVANCSLPFSDVVDPWPLMQMEWSVRNKMVVGKLSLDDIVARQVPNSFQPTSLHSLILDTKLLPHTPVRDLCVGLIDRNPSLTSLEINAFSETVVKSVLKLSNLKYLQIESSAGIPLNEARFAYIGKIVMNNKNLESIRWVSYQNYFSFRYGVLDVVSKRGFRPTLKNIIVSLKASITKMIFHIRPLTVSVLREILLCVPQNVIPICQTQRKLKVDFFANDEDLRDRFQWHVLSKHRYI